MTTLSDQLRSRRCPGCEVLCIMAADELDRLTAALAAERAKWQTAIRTFAGTEPLDLLRPHEVQERLRALAEGGA